MTPAQPTPAAAGGPAPSPFAAGGPAPSPFAGLLAVDERGCRRLAAELFAGTTPTLLPAADFDPPAPFAGPLFAAIEGFARAAASATAAASAGTAQAGRPAAEPAGAQAAALMGLVVPVIWLGPPPPPDAVLVADHVNLTLRGPLSGRWPAGRPRAFPVLTGVYQPLAGRACEGPRVYSLLAVAGVQDAQRLTPFERSSIAVCGLPAASACLVAPVVIAAYYGLRVAAAGAPLGPTAT